MTVVEPSVQPKKKGCPKGKPRQSKVHTTTVLAAPTTTISNETPEQRRARLLQELAEVNQQVAPASSQPTGPNYWAMSHNDLKKALIGRSMIDRSGTREGMVGMLQADDMKAGLQPHPRENENAMSGLRAGNTQVHVEPHTRDAVRIIDQDGNQYATVHRIGKMINGNPVLLDMEGNARKIAAVLNEGRL